MRKRYTVKKKIVSLLCAGMLTLSLPTLAWADPSPSNQATATDPNTSTAITVDSPYNTDNGGVEVAHSTQHASNYQPPASGNGDALVSTFEITTWGNLEGRDDISVTMVFNVGSQYAGMTARIYVQHNDGTTENHTTTVSSDGSVSFSMDRLSWVTIAIEAGQTPAAATTGGTTGSTDTSATSPKTGVDMAGAAGVTAVAAIAAGGVALALRKKVTE